ncbi:MAG TPA: mechanosensitive ion channel family protein, partial [Thermoanaerobaculia bacterium]|nr:mechanosensitive ion channel family protein [Thermoanaerobaculia bacterium]
WKATASVAAVLTAWVLFSLLDSLVFQRPWNLARGPMMPKLARDVLRVGVLAGTVLVAATAILDQPLPAVLVSSTVLSAVVGLALQDVLKNVFAGMALELEKPFDRGEWLLLDGQPAQVLETSWRSVKLRTLEGLDVYEPNATFSGARLTNLGSGARPMALTFRVGVSYEAPPARVKEALLRAARAAPGGLESPAPQAIVESYGDSAILYRLRVWTRQVGELGRFQDAVNSRVWYELKRQGLTIPFPIRTVMLRHVEEEAGRDQAAFRERATALLADLPLFRDLAPDASRQLAAAARHQHYDHGEVLVREGERGDSLFVIDQGRVVITKSGAMVGTGTIDLASLGPGGFFGEMSLLTGEPRSATVTADGPVEVLVLPREALAPLLAADPGMAEQLSAAVIERQAEVRARLDRRERQRTVEEIQAESSLLERIRSFFKLPG